MYVWRGSYNSVAGAELDYKAVEHLYSSEKLGSYDYALVEKDAEGNVHVHKHEKPTQHGTWWGIAAGAVVGILVPPPYYPARGCRGRHCGLYQPLVARLYAQGHA